MFKKKTAWNYIYMNGVLSMTNISKKKARFLPGPWLWILDSFHHLCVTDTKKWGIAPLKCIIMFILVQFRLKFKAGIT